ncbi:zinc transporter ZIP4-like [Parambassis ranga]|uniref:Zinc transporter ZIP4 n=1 Tax=Parambassis ranga TaxID=210632 RepID=A0A6P7HPV1_9TELE|nr:zinc transporter ZIP4-like [Parambassis ranga]
MFSSSPLLLLLLFPGWGAFGSVSGSPAVEEVFGAVVGVVSPGQQHLTGPSLRSLFNTLEHRVQCGEVSCEKCDLADAVHQLINHHSVHEDEATGKAGENVTIRAPQFTALAAGSVLYLSSPGLVCTAIRQGRWGEEAERFIQEISPRAESEPHADIHDVDVLLHKLGRHYEPSDSERCTTSSDIMEEVHASSHEQGQEVGAVLAHVLYHALLGHCLIGQPLPEESFFLDYIMDWLGSENSTIEDLKVLMRSLNLGRDHKEDEHAHHDHQGQRRRKRSSHEHPERNSTWEQHCFSAEQLVLIYSLGDNKSDPAGLGRSDVARLSPALIEQILSGACTHITEPVKQDGLSTAERYLYATIANVVITLTSMFGIVVLLCASCTSVFQLCIQFCISMAVGALTGDALLHLIPMFLGLHVHSDNNDGNPASHTDHQDETPDYVYKMLVVIAGIYYFYLMETIFSLVTHKDNHHHHQHHHAEESEPHHCDHGRVLEMYQQERKQKESQSISKANLVGCDDNEKSLSGQTEHTREQRLLPYMITFGDGIHNFADGLAMGAAFSLSWKSGLATSVAVLCHEIPHELGDFAILLHCGVSVRRALLLNFASGMTSFIGLYIALSVATDLATKQWIAAITAGLFLYVGLADMLPTMVHIRNKRPWLMFLLQNVGLLTGWGILLLMSMYEEKISF